MSDMIMCINCKHLRRDDWCERIADSPHEYLDRRCDFFQTATKADIIRRMPEEELARFLCEITGPCLNCLAKRCCGAGQNGFLDWLKEESNGQKSSK